MAERSADDFVKQAEMDNPIQPPLHLDRMIREAYAFAEKVWRNAAHDDFVDHGVDHAYNDLRKAFRILRVVLAPHGVNERLSNLERAVLACAALFHDIGMQWSLFAPHAERLSLEHARRDHIPNGRRLLEWSMRGENDSVPSLMHVPEFHSTYGYAMLVGLSHSGETEWKSLTESTPPGDDWGPQDTKLRLKLLAAAFRLADEIDNSHDRIISPERLLGENLDADTCAHWCACNYIRDVRVGPPGAGLVIDVVPRVPLSSPDDASYIIELLEDYRLRRMREEAKRVAPFLRVGDSPKVLWEVRRTDSFLEEIDALPERVRALIESRRADRAAQERLARPEQVVVQPVELNETLQAARDILRKEHGGGDRLSRSQHIALRSGYHCNRYYFFDQFLGDTEFLEVLTRGLVEYYQEKGITLVVGVGTAGTLIAAALSAKLGARLSYTFAQVREAPRTATAAHSELDVEVDVMAGDVVLVVDDIIGMGTALTDVVFRLRGVAGAELSITAFALLRTARQPAQEDELADVETLALHEASGVEYWNEGADRRCEMCREDSDDPLREY